MSVETTTTTTSTPAILRVENIADGLVKEVIAEGDGPLPQRGDQIVAHYTGRLLDGSIFDSSYNRNMPFKFELGEGAVIAGWDQGFATMKKHEKAFLVCSPSFAYGARGHPPTIPANATLKFEVELLNFGPAPGKPVYRSDKAKIAEAETRKAEGNSAFSRGDLHGALEEYKSGWNEIEFLREEESFAESEGEKLTATDLSSLASLRVILNSNMSMVYLKLGAYPEAAKAATQALSFDKQHAKSLFRRGTARVNMGLLEEAKEDLLAAAKAAPTDASIRAELDRIKALVNAAKAREKKAFGGIFNRKGFSLDEGGEGEEGEKKKEGDTAAASNGAGNSSGAGEAENTTEEEKPAWA